MTLIIENESIRLDSLFCQRFSALSRTKIQSIIKDNLSTFKLNSLPIKKSSQNLKEGDKLEFDETLFNKKEIEDVVLFKNPPKLNIIYEDDEILLINKEQGISCHHGSGIDSGTVEDALYYRLGEERRAELSDVHFGLVHRLDKDTSGLLLIAKDKTSCSFLKEQFKERQVYKEYIACALGMVVPTLFSVETGLTRNPKDRKKFTTCSFDEGRYSKSDFEVIEYLKDKVTVLKVVLHTGRTHQIRVHLQSISHPIIGDSIYARKREEFQDFSLMLHSRKLSFIHPKTKELVSFESEIPERFYKLKEFICLIK